MPLTKEEEMLIAAGREFLDPLYYRHTGGGAVFGDSLDIDWITKDGVIVATGTNWPVEIQIYVPWGNVAVVRGAVAHELLECGAGPWTGGEVRRYTKPHIVLGGGGAYRWQPEFDGELVTAARCGDAEEVRCYLRNHINVVAVVLDNVKLGPVVTYELLAELGRSGLPGRPTECLTETRKYGQIWLSTCFLMPLRRSGRRHKIAIGLTGDPVPVGRRSGAMTHRNDQRRSRSHSGASSLNSR
jgi:hypothetical protein